MDRFGCELLRKRPKSHTANVGKVEHDDPVLDLEIGAHPRIEVRRSSRRKRTISAFREGETIVIAIPARMTKREEASVVPEMVERVKRQELKLRPGDRELEERAKKLSKELFGGKTNPSSVRWSEQMSERWGSCTLDDASIRLSARLRGMPRYVLDYVLIHELAHLLEAGHTERFYELESRFGQGERAKGFLEGWSASTQSRKPD